MLMKTQNLLFALCVSVFALLFASNAFSKPLHTETATFKVYGNCSMCKKTIETALKKNAHIIKADWNVESKMISVEYDPHMISVDEIHKIIADAGYDTDKVKASDAAYKKLPSCCQYERKK